MLDELRLQSTLDHPTEVVAVVKGLGIERLGFLSIAWVRESAR